MRVIAVGVSSKMIMVVVTVVVRAGVAVLKH